MLFQHDSLCAEKCGFIKPEVKRDVIREVAAAAKGAHAGLLRVRRRGPFQREECGVDKVLVVNQGAACQRWCTEFLQYRGPAIIARNAISPKTVSKSSAL